MIIKTQFDVTAAVLAELQRADNPRFKQVMTAAVRHTTVNPMGPFWRMNSPATRNGESIVRSPTPKAAGVRQIVYRHAQGHGGMRLLEPSFMSIQQAIGTPAGHESGARYLAGFIAEMSANGFVADSLARSGQLDAAVAPGCVV